MTSPGCWPRILPLIHSTPLHPNPIFQPPGLLRCLQIDFLLSHLFALAHDALTAQNTLIAFFLCLSLIIRNSARSSPLAEGFREQPFLSSPQRLPHCPLLNHLCVCFPHWPRLPLYRPDTPAWVKFLYFLLPWSDSIVFRTQLS